MALNTVESIELLESINYEDSSLLGLSVDIFKVRLLINAELSPNVERFGFGPYADLCFDFRHINSLLFSIHKGVFGPPYLDDGDLSAISFANFGFGLLDLRKVGKTHPLAYMLEDRELIDEYEVNIPFRMNGSVSFRFAELKVGTFVPESLDPWRNDLP